MYNPEKKKFQGKKRLRNVKGNKDRQKKFSDKSNKNNPNEEFKKIFDNKEKEIIKKDNNNKSIIENLEKEHIHIFSNSISNLNNILKKQREKYIYNIKKGNKNEETKIKINSLLGKFIVDYFKNENLNYNKNLFQTNPKRSNYFEKNLQLFKNENQINKINKYKIIKLNIDSDILNKLEASSIKKENILNLLQNEEENDDIFNDQSDEDHNGNSLKLENELDKSKSNCKKVENKDKINIINDFNILRNTDLATLLKIYK